MHLSAPMTEWYGYKLVGDNVDKYVKRRHVRSDRCNITIISKHTRLIDVSSYSDVTPTPPSCISDDIINKLLPSKADDYNISNFAHHVAVILTEHNNIMHFFKVNFADVVKKNIRHKFSLQMGSKSEVISTCISNLHVHVHNYNS